MEALPSGVDSDQLNDGAMEEDELQVDRSLRGDFGEDDDFLNISGERSHDLEPTPKRKKPADNPVPQLIDNKRKNLEKQLSAAQRDVQEAKDESQSRREIAQAVKESNAGSIEALKSMTESMSQISQAFCKSFEALAHALQPQALKFSPQHQLLVIMSNVSFICTIVYSLVHIIIQI